MITYTLLGLIIAFSAYGFSNPQIMNKYLFHPYSIHHNKEHYRFLTHAFIHGDFVHLGFNALALYGFGLSLENNFFPLIYGSPQMAKLMFLILFTGGIYAASLTEYFRNRNNVDYSSLGASGAISSVLFVHILIYPKGTIGFFFIPMPSWLAGVLLLSVSYYLIQRKRKSNYSDTISHEAHFWGAIFGILFIALTKPSILLSFFRQLF